MKLWLFLGLEELELLSNVNITDDILYEGEKLSLIHIFGKLDTEEIDAADIQVNKEAEETGEGYTNVALFGIDSRSGELEKGTRTDCIIVALSLIHI